MRLIGNYDEFTLGSLPPGTMQKENGKFLWMQSDYGSKPWVGTVRNLPEGQGSIHYLRSKKDGKMTEVVISHTEETCRERGAKMLGKRMFRKPDEDIWIDLVPAAPREG